MKHTFNYTISNFSQLINRIDLHLFTKKVSTLLFLMMGLMLTACSPAKPISYHGIDITGNSQFSSDFTLPNLNQEKINLKSIMQKSQKNSILIFGYTACPDYCPSTLAKISEVKQILKTKNIDVDQKLNIFFVTIDAKRDKPEVLKKYLAAFDEKIIGFTAAGDDLATLKKNFKIAVEEQGSLINHTTGLYLLDAKGEARLYLPYNLTAQQIADDVANLAQ